MDQLISLQNSPTKKNVNAARFCWATKPKNENAVRGFEANLIKPCFYIIGSGGGRTLKKAGHASGWLPTEMSNRILGSWFELPDS